MDFLTLIIIAIGLCADSFAISVTSGIIIKDVRLKQSLKIAGSLAFFQALMPFIGWLAGYGFREMIKNFDHWIAFGLLSIIGIKMIIDGLRNKPGDKKINPTNTLMLIGLSIATSIDALIVGISFAFLDVSILKSCLVIGIFTFAFSISGIYLGCKFCKIVNFKLDVIAGFVLIGIGVKILLQHIL